MRRSNAALHASARHPTCRAAIGASHPYQPNWPTLSCRTPSLLYTHAVQDTLQVHSHKTVRDASNLKWGQACRRPSQKTRRQDPAGARHAHAGPACPADLAGAQIGAASLRMRTPQPPKPKPPQGVRRAPAQGQGRAGPRRTPAGALYTSKHRNKQGGAGPRAGF